MHLKTTTCKEDDNLNPEEIKYVNINQIITVADWQTLNSHHLNSTKR